jgi:archaellum component FlaF (FlaF/FlaG flagellin family)
MGGAIVVEPWRKSGSHVVVHGAPWPAQVLLNGQPIAAERLEYLAPTRSLVIALPDAATARLEIVARDE